MISIITPVHNEASIIEENSKKIIEYMDSYSRDLEFLIIDNGSTDSTLEKAKALAAGDSRVRVLSLPEKDLGAALRAGILEAKGEYIVWYPIDISVNLKYISDSLQQIRGYDIIVGSKEHPNSKVVRPWIRKFLSLVYSRMVNALFGLGLSDTQCVKTFRSSSVKDVALESKSSGIIWEVELLYRSRRKKLKIKETPVEVCDLRKGSTIKPFDILKAFINMLRLRLKI